MAKALVVLVEYRVLILRLEMVEMVPASSIIAIQVAEVLLETQVMQLLVL